MVTAKPSATAARMAERLGDAIAIRQGLFMRSRASVAQRRSAGEHPASMRTARGSMPNYPDDIYTEIDDFSPDTLANLGPLRRLAGV